MNTPASQTIYTIEGVYVTALNGSHEVHGVRYARDTRKTVAHDPLAAAMNSVALRGPDALTSLAIVHVPGSGWDGSAVLAMRNLLDDLLPDGPLAGAVIVAELPDNQGATVIVGTITGHTPSALTITVNERTVDCEYECVAVLAI